ncbi:MAG: oligogalacturonate lyase family protein [Planctomycetaceae bacterium]|jgi:oligogalacturonide lyase|nr:oligogalacturonate lyase family protein [Planctomycetaceae bacterium]
MTNLLFRFSTALFIVTVFIGFSGICLASDVGKRYPSEKTTWVDPVTKKTLTVLTKSAFNDQKPYQTHETWTADGKWIIFRSNRSGRGNQIFVVNEQSGDIVQLTDDESLDSASMNLSRKEMKMFYMRGSSQKSLRQLVELNLAKLLPDVTAGTVKNPMEYERIIVTLPSDGKSSGFALDADESRLYWGNVLREPSPEFLETEKVEKKKKPRHADPSVSDGYTSRLSAIDIKTGTISTILDLNFRIGHVQANPWVPGEVFYCHETGGDAPQRIRSVKTDGTNNCVVYWETPDEWVTHEVVSAPDEMMFILSGNEARLREKPCGIAVVNLRTKQMELLGQTSEIFWHCNGLPKNHRAVGDTHKGSIFVINRETGERIRLTTGHPMKPDHTHPIFSPDGLRILIQSGILNEGKTLDLMTINVP